MADVIKELMDSLKEFEVSMDKDLNQMKYDNCLLNYVFLRKKFINILDDHDIPLESKALKAIEEKRLATKYYKSDEALKKIKEEFNS